MMNMVIMIIRIITRKKTMINDEYGHDVHYSLHYVVHYFVHYEDLEALLLSRQMDQHQGAQGKGIFWMKILVENLEP